MKLKYYLRGLGIGIIVTAIVMSVTGKTEELTDAEIKIRAAQLGMVEKSVLADIQKENETSIDIKNETVEEPVADTGEGISDIDSENEAVEEPVADTGEGASDTDSENEVVDEPAINIEESASDIDKEHQENEDIQVEENVENYIIINIESGNGSEVVCRKLFEAGLVNSASEYNKYLISNGYDRKLRRGNHEIPADATEEEIAKILCGMR